MDREAAARIASASWAGVIGFLMSWLMSRNPHFFSPVSRRKN